MVGGKYPGDKTDNYLESLFDIPNYWVLRENGYAFAAVNVICRNQVNLKRYVATGLASHSVLTHLGGAVYHLEQIKEITKRTGVDPQKIGPD